METNKVNNKHWNGKDSAFLRCISSINKSFYDVPIMYGADGGKYSQMCECASLFVESITGSGDYMPFDYWIKFETKDGEIVDHSDKQLGYLCGVCGVDELLFKGDINTLEIKTVSMIMPKGYGRAARKVSEMSMVEDKESFIKAFEVEFQNKDSFML